MKLKKAALSLALCAVTASVAIGAAACGSTVRSGDYYTKKSSYKVGICQLVQHPALDAATAGFMDTLKEKVEAAGKTVEFDKQNASGENTVCTTIVNNFVAADYDLILANATASLQAAANATLKIPILGTSITDYASALNLTGWNGTVGGNISGTSDLAPLDKQADIFTDLLPEAKKVGILYCSAEPNSKYQADTIKPYLEAKGITVTYYSFTDSNDIATVLNGLKNKVDALYIPTDNTAANNTALIDSICRPARIPIVAGEEGICGGCGIGTLSISYRSLGEKTGEMAAEILLEGKLVSDMPVQYADATTYKYNAAICTELGITVPQNYEAIAVSE